MGRWGLVVVKLGRVSHEATQHPDVAMTIPRPDKIRAKGLGTCFWQSRRSERLSGPGGGNHHRERVGSGIRCCSGDWLGRDFEHHSHTKSAPAFAPQTFARRRAGRHRDARGIAGVPPVACGRYSITVSASPSSVGGMVRLRSFAVLRLSAKSKRVGRSTGKSDGFSPLRICPAYTPTLRNASRMSEP